MKRIFILCLSIFLTIALAGCSGSESPASSQGSGQSEPISVTTIEGLSCKTEKDSYPADATTIKVLIENQTDSLYSFDSNISIVQKYEDNQWSTLPLNDAVNLGASVSLKQGKTAQAEFQIGTLLTNPQPGRYRVVLSLKDDNKKEDRNLAAEFTLT